MAAPTSHSTARIGAVTRKTVHLQRGQHGRGRGRGVSSSRRSDEQRYHLSAAAAAARPPLATHLQQLQPSSALPPSVPAWPAPAAAPPALIAITPGAAVGVGPAAKQRSTTPSFTAAAAGGSVYGSALTSRLPSGSWGVSVAMRWR